MCAPSVDGTWHAQCMQKLLTQSGGEWEPNKKDPVICVFCVRTPHAIPIYKRFEHGA
jgi:hypothetical protein